MTTRNRVVALRLTDQEYAHLVGLAAADGISLSDVIRLTLRGRRSPVCMTCGEEFYPAEPNCSVNCGGA